MGALRILAALILVIAMPAKAADPVARWRPYVDEASQRFGIPAAWIERVLYAESRGRTHRNGRPITSSAGAMGLMQLMPATWAAMRDRYALGPDPYDPRDNILAGTAFLRQMHDRFGYPGLFAAYNAGPSRYARHLATGATLPPETRDYMAIVAATDDPPMPAPSPSRSSLFFATGRHQRAPSSPEIVTNSEPDGR